MKVCKLNDDELLLLYDLNRSNNLALPYDSFPHFNFDDLEDDECLSEFLFHKRDLPLFADLYNEVNELIISRCVIRLEKQFSACRLIKILLNYWSYDRNWKRLQNF